MTLITPFDPEYSEGSKKPKMTELEKIEVELAPLKKEYNEMCSKVGVLEDRLVHAKISEVFSSGALKEAKWRIEPKGYTLYGTSDVFKKLAKLLENDYHCSSSLMKGVAVYFNDGEITISFENSALVFDFIYKNQIKLDLTNIVKHRDRMKKELESLNKFLKKFNKK